MKLSRKLTLSLAVLLFASANLFAQGGGNLRGTVRDAEGNVLPGAAIFVEGTTIGTATDINGAYLLQNIPTGKRQITVNYIGYEDVAETFDFSAGETKIYDVVMSDLNQGIEQVTMFVKLLGVPRRAMFSPSDVTPLTRFSASATFRSGNMPIWSAEMTCI